ncbi:MAG: hypothetical protein ACFCUR_11150 [Rhodomicrobiaceae bacterium]
MRVSTKVAVLSVKDRRTLEDPVIDWKVLDDFVTAGALCIQKLRGGLKLHLFANDFIC